MGFDYYVSTWLEVEYDGKEDSEIGKEFHIQIFKSGGYIDGLSPPSTINGYTSDDDEWEKVLDQWYDDELKRCYSKKTLVYDKNKGGWLITSKSKINYYTTLINNYTEPIYSYIDCDYNDDIEVKVEKVDFDCVKTIHRVKGAGWR